jgi:carbohydrate kinase (thermoresistant glucokinase family)
VNLPTRRIVVMGVAGCGKTTVGRLLADALGWAFVEGDDLHPAANVDKMAAGRPLDDGDRWPWLDRIARRIEIACANRAGLVLACSALRRSYRDSLRTADPRLSVVHLTGAPDLLAERLKTRQGHFMPVSLLRSQLATLEAPTADEQVLTLDISGDAASLAAQAAAWIRDGQS